MMEKQEPVKAVLIGAGNRGRHAYGRWALEHGDQIRFTAVAEPVKTKREGFAGEHGIPADMRFNSWQDLLDQGLLSEACLICTQDQMHVDPAVKALNAGYHVLLEKPMAVTEADCKQLVQKAVKTGKQLRICHVVRYTGLFSRVKQAINDGLTGQIVNIEHAENVAYWHFPHAYVRGNWRKSEESSPVILAKTCHDFDILYWLVGVPVKSIQSFGGLSFFRKENAPPSAPERCTDGCPIEETCLWYAPRFYIKAEPLVRISQNSGKRRVRFAGKMILEHRRFAGALSNVIKPLKKVLNWEYWPTTVITDDLSREGKMKALREGPYGRCVFRCDNDVPDHQTVNILFENGVTATMTMQGLSHDGGRWFRISGTEGTLTGKWSSSGEELVYHDLRHGGRTVLWKKDVDMTFSHGGGDGGLMASFIASLRSPKPDSLTSASASLESHLMAFAAEKSRLENRVVEMSEMR